MRQLIRAAALVAALLFLAPVAAQSAAEDEARIEELIRRERARNRPVAATAETQAAQAGVPTAAVAASPATGTPTQTIAPAAPAVATGSALAPPRDAPIEPTIFGDDVMPHDPDSIAIADLAAHVGRHVRVRSHGGRVRIGRIESVGGDRLTLTTPMGGGFAKYTLPFSQITGIERL